MRFFGYQGFGSGVFIEFQAVARCQGSMERPDCKLIFRQVWMEKAVLHEIYRTIRGIPDTGGSASGESAI